MERLEPIKTALKDVELRTQHGKISLPKVERLGEAMQKGEYYHQ